MNSSSQTPSKVAEILDNLELNDRGCYTIKETSTHLVEVLPMIFNDRVALTPKAFPDAYDYGWCYDKGAAAFLAAATWDPDTEAEPVGFKKRVGLIERKLDANVDTP